MSKNAVLITYSNIEDQADNGLEAYDIELGKKVTQPLSDKSDFKPSFASYSPDTSHVLGVSGNLIGIAEVSQMPLDFKPLDFKPEDISGSYQVIPSWLSDSSGLLIAITQRSGSNIIRSFYTYDLQSKSYNKLVTLSQPGVFARLLGNNKKRNEFYVSTLSSGKESQIVDTLIALSLSDGSPVDLDLPEELTVPREVAVRGGLFLYNIPNENGVNILNVYNPETKTVVARYTPDYLKSPLAATSAKEYIGASSPYIVNKDATMLYMSAVDSIEKGTYTTEIIELDLATGAVKELYSEKATNLLSILDIGGISPSGNMLLYRRCLTACDQPVNANQQLYVLDQAGNLKVIKSARASSNYFGYEVR